jgi:hypothetical protein
MLERQRCAFKLGKQAGSILAVLLAEEELFVGLAITIYKQRI